MTWRRFVAMAATGFAAGFAGTLAILGYDIQRAVRHIGRTERNSTPWPTYVRRHPGERAIHIGRIER